MHKITCKYRLYIIIKMQEDISIAEVVSGDSFWRVRGFTYGICFRKGSSQCLLEGVEASSWEQGAW